MTTKLTPGNYMKVSKVLETLNHKWCKPTLATVAEKVLTKHSGEHDVYFSTEELKSIMIPDLFKELECEVVTHMIIADK